MPRLIISSALAAAVMSLWTAFSWAIWQPLQDLPNETILIETLKTSVTEPGVYRFPGVTQVEGTSATSKIRWLQKASEGPFGYLVLRPEGVDPTAIGVYIRNYLIHFLSCALLVYLMILARIPSFRQRYFAVLIFGGAFAAFTYLQQWNWLFYPLSFSLARGLDALLAWALAGPFIAWGYKAAGTKKGA